MTIGPEFIYFFLFSPYYVFGIFYDAHFSLGAYDLFHLNNIYHFQYDNNLIIDRNIFFRQCHTYKHPFVVHTADNNMFLISEIMSKFKSNPIYIIEHYEFFLKKYEAYNLKIIIRIDPDKLDIYRKLKIVIKRTENEHNIYVLLNDDKISRM